MSSILLNTLHWIKNSIDGELSCDYIMASTRIREENRDTENVDIQFRPNIVYNRLDLLVIIVFK